jgi:hypothetical protein
VECSVEIREILALAKRHNINTFDAPFVRAQTLAGMAGGQPRPIIIVSVLGLIIANQSATGYFLRREYHSTVSLTGRIDVLAGSGDNLIIAARKRIYVGKAAETVILNPEIPLRRTKEVIFGNIGLG